MRPNIDIHEWKIIESHWDPSNQIISEEKQHIMLLQGTHQEQLNLLLSEVEEMSQLEEVACLVVQEEVLLRLD